MYLFSRISNDGITFIPFQAAPEALPLNEWQDSVMYAVECMRELVDKGGFYTCAVVALDLKTDDLDIWQRQIKDEGYTPLPMEDKSRLMKEFGAWPRCIPLGQNYHPEYADLWCYGKVKLPEVTFLP
jgi:hypothetical protein